MAIRDYIVCKRCEYKIIYDEHYHGREMMQALWGDPSAVFWTPLLLCPACIALLESELAECIVALEKIANPISAMKRALPIGATLNGAMATTLSNDPNYLKEIAKAALAARKGEGE